jgi:hypothetical protein
MAILYKLFYKITNGDSLAGIHDCFLVTANNASTLIDALKAVYIKIYVSDQYLIKFDNLLIHTLEYHSEQNSEFIFDKAKRLVIYDYKEYILPKPNEVRVIDFPDFSTSTPAIYINFYEFVPLQKKT